jgi:cysteine-rich protein
MALTPDTSVTFWYGCNMARHGEIVRLVTQILTAVGVTAAPAGGPSYCCGSPQEANARIAAGMAARTVEKFNATGRDTVVTWCPSCHMNMDDLMAPVTEAAFETQHITQLLAARADRLRPLLANPVPARVLLHAHHGFNGRVPVNTDVPMLLAMIPGLTMLDHKLRIPAHMCSAIAPKPGELARAHRETLDAMQETGADTLATVFHSCHRDAVSLERARPIRVANWIHLLAEAMGLPYTDEYKLWRNAEDPRAAIGEDRIAEAGDVAYAQLVDPELRRPPILGNGIP